MQGVLLKLGAIVVLLVLLLSLFTTENGRSLLQPVPAGELIDVLPKDAIPAILEPEFSNESWLEPGDRVVGLAVGDDARAYPVRILNWHEIVNDVVGGEPVAVTFCPLCGTGMVFDRRLDGETLSFGVSGKLYRNDLVMYDHQSESYWSQVLGLAIRGTHSGRELEQLPAWTMRWDEWQARHPDTLLLARPVGADGDYPRDYDVDPYDGYALTRDTYFTVERQNDTFHPKTMVAGVVLEGEPKAYLFSALRQQRLVNDVVGGVPVVLTWVNGAPSAFLRSSDNLTLLDETTMQDSQGRNYSLASGEALDGGAALEPLPLVTGFWFGWYDFHPDTGLYTSSSTGASATQFEEPARAPGPGLLLVPGMLLLVAWLMRRR